MGPATALFERRRQEREAQARARGARHSSKCACWARRGRVRLLKADSLQRTLNKQCSTTLLWGLRCTMVLHMN